MRTFIVALLISLLATPVFAQPPVNNWVDWASYGTAAINPVGAFTQAYKSGDRSCQLEKFFISNLVGNALTITIKQVVKSPRPCLGCGNDGMPSGHTMNSVIGISHTWKWGGAGAIAATGLLRVLAHRHTWSQVIAGAGIGLGAELVGQLMPCYE